MLKFIVGLVIVLSGFITFVSADNINLSVLQYPSQYKSKNNNLLDPFVDLGVRMQRIHQQSNVIEKHVNQMKGSHSFAAIKQLQGPLNKIKTHFSKSVILTNNIIRQAKDMTLKNLFINLAQEYNYCQDIMNKAISRINKATFDKYDLNILEQQLIPCIAPGSNLACQYCFLRYSYKSPNPEQSMATNCASCVS